MKRCFFKAVVIANLIVAGVLNAGTNSFPWMQNRGATNTSSGVMKFSPQMSGTNQFAQRRVALGRSQSVISDVGPHSRAWVSVSETTNTSTLGPLAERKQRSTRRVVEMATGMNYWNGQQWVPSDASFEATDEGFFANKVQHSISLSANLYMSRAVSVAIPEHGRKKGLALESTPLAIALYDPASGESMIIGTLTNCWGTLVGTNRVVYENAFHGISADVVYTLERGSFSQDVVLTEHVDPADWGFSANCQLQIITEFYSNPEPDRIRNPIRIEPNALKRKRMASPDFIDSTLGFGEFVMGTGKAFTITPANTIEDGPIVAKELTTINGRVFLMESIEYPSMQTALMSLPRKVGADSGIHGRKDKAKTAYAAIPLPSSNRADSGRAGVKPPIKKMAALSRSNGVCIDYSATIGGTITSSITFVPEETYIIAGPLHCNGPVVIEGGTIFKYVLDAYIDIKNSIVCKTTPYRMAIFTSVTDDTIGDSAYYCPEYTSQSDLTAFANPALLLNNIVSPLLSNMRFFLCKQAIKVIDIANTASAAVTISDSQFVHCLQGVTITVSGCGCGSGCGTVVALKNSLFDNVDYPISFPVNSYSSQRGVFTNCTISAAATLAMSGTGSPNGGYAASITFVNSVLDRIGSLNSGSTFAPIYSGSYNGFFQSPTFGSNTRVATESPFQTSERGNYYLADSSGFRGVGTPSIGTDIIADLQGRSTHPPVSIPFWTCMNSELQLLKQASRYMSGPPDLGYHYAAMDYSIACIIVEGGIKVRILPGTVVGFRNYGDQAPENDLQIGDDAFGFYLSAGSSLESLGSLTMPITYVNQAFVQEQFGGFGFISAFEPSYYGDAREIMDPPTLKFRFSNFNLTFNDIHILGGRTPDFINDYSGNFSGSSFMMLDIRDCSFHGGKITLNLAATFDNQNKFLGMGAGNISIQNNLFEHVDLLLDPGYQQGIVSDYVVKISNNLFRYGILGIYPNPDGTSDWKLRDNLFDQVSFSQVCWYNVGTIPVDCDFNAFWPASSDLVAFTSARWYGTWYGPGTSAILVKNNGMSSDNDITLGSAPAYQSGLLGNYYLAKTSPLVNKGSQSPAAAGLRQYTTRTDQKKDGEETDVAAPDNVNIGLHYVTMNTVTKLPKDSDVDGLFDYVEDANGNGVCDADTETDIAIAQTTAGVADALNPIYDDVDLSGNGLVGRIKKALGMTPFATQQLTLTQIITGKEPNIVTFKLPINYTTLASIGGLNLDVDGDDATLEESKSDSDGQCLIVWNTTYESPYSHFLQAKLTLIEELGNTIKSGVGPILFFKSGNQLQFDEAYSFFNDSSAILYAEVQGYQAADYTIEIKTTAGEHISTIFGTTTSGIINETWDLTYDDYVTHFTGESIEANFIITTIPPVMGKMNQNDVPSGQKQILNKVTPVTDGCFDVAYAYNCDSAFLSRDGVFFKAMQGVVDKLMTTRTGVGEDVYLSTYNTFWTAGDPGNPGYLQDRAGAIALLEDLKKPSTLNFFFKGHGSSQSIGDGTKNPGRPYLRASEVAAALGNSFSAEKAFIVKHPYRFVWLDGCKTGCKNWRHAFGIYSKGKGGQEVAGIIGEQAFFGWKSDISNLFGNEATATSCHDYGETLNKFYSSWMTGKPLYQCIQDASAKTLYLPLPVPGNEHVTLSDGTKHKRATSEAYVIGYIGLKRKGSL